MRPDALLLERGDRALATDLYQLTMMAAYWQREQQEGAPIEATFELFVRDLPGVRRFLVAAGLEQAVSFVLDVAFTTAQVEFLRSLPVFAAVPDEFFAWLSRMRFTGDVHAVPEGTLVFDDEPLVRVTAPIAQAQLLETYLLSTINLQTAVASKAARIRLAAGDREVSDFGTRRAHGAAAGIAVARAAWIGGVDATSNVEAARRLGMPAVGTAAHSYVMSFDDERDAFAAYRALYPDHAVLLVDTYDTLRGVERAIATGPGLAGVRLDSGDLGELAHATRRLLDRAGESRARIVASGDLDEHAIAELCRRDAPIDAFGVGTRLAVSEDDPSLGAVYKLVERRHGDVATPVMKLSGSKATLPGRKQVWRVHDGDRLDHDVVELEGHDGPAGGAALLVPVVRDGVLVEGALDDERAARARCREGLASLPGRLSSFDPFPPDEGPPVRIGTGLSALADDVRARVTPGP